MCVKELGLMSRTFSCAAASLLDGTEETATCSVGSATASHTVVRTCTQGSSYPKKAKRRMTLLDWTAIKWLGMLGCLWKKRKGC